MLKTALLLAALAAAPAEKLATAFPASRRVATADGQRLVHASGFLADTGASKPEDAARAFLATHGAAFGVSQRQALVAAARSTSSEMTIVRFGRTIDGLPVLGGDMVVGVDPQNRVFIVNSGDVPPAVSGSHRLGEAAARSAAIASFKQGLSGAGPAQVTAGWKTLGSSVRAVYQVDFIAQKPAGDWRVYVDGETGKALFRLNRRQYATGNLYEISPVETLAAQCTATSGGVLSLCASSKSATIPNLTGTANLTGTQVTALNCKGADYPQSVSTIATTCSAVSSSGGNFDFDPDLNSTTGVSRNANDDFSAVMAYYHLDKHVSFLKSLDSSVPSGTHLALTGSIPAMVNAYGPDPTTNIVGPYDNAFYSPDLDAMVFGQGTNVDYAYDATVMYHEFTHAVVQSWGGFDEGVDSYGWNLEPGAVNEGTADSMAASETGRSQIGGYIGGYWDPANPMAALRDQSDPNVTRTCHGNGTAIATFSTGFPPLVNGMDGEEHDDGEIWNGFFWDVYSGLRAAGVKGCNGNCEAGAAIQYKALQLAAGTAPTFATYWQTMKSAAQQLFPSQTAVADYVDCMAKRRQLDQCDRTVPVYKNELKQQYVSEYLSPFQYVITTTGDTSVSFCSLGGQGTYVYYKKGTHVGVALSGSDLSFDADGVFVVDPRTSKIVSKQSYRDGDPLVAQCFSTGGFASLPLTGAGTYYLALLSMDQAQGTTTSTESYTLGLLSTATNVASRPTSASLISCSYGGGSGPDGGTADGGSGTTDGGSSGGKSGGCGTAFGADLAVLLSLGLAALLRRARKRREEGSC